MEPDTDPKHGENWVERLAGIAVVFGLLGKAFYSYADRAWLQSLADEHVLCNIPFGANQADIKKGLEALRAWTAENCDGMSNEVYDSLRGDYTHLFTMSGPSFSPPWESFYFDVDNLLFQEKTVMVRNWYRRFNLEPENPHKEPEDHIGLELSFVGHLAARGLTALERNDDKTLEDVMEALKAFLSQHLLCWGPGWCLKVAGVARTDFYRGIALLTRGALHEVAEILNIAVPDQPSVGV